jgi:hypothetical protein
MNVLPPSSVQPGRSTTRSATRENGGKPAIAPRVSWPAAAAPCVSGPALDYGVKTSVQDDVSVAAQQEKGLKPGAVPRVSGSVLKNGGKPAIQPRVSGLPPPGNNNRCYACMKSATRVFFTVEVFDSYLFWAKLGIC